MKVQLSAPPRSCCIASCVRAASTRNCTTRTFSSGPNIRTYAASGITPGGAIAASPASGAGAGISLGGNVTAKWFGESGASLPDEVRGGAVVSVPFDLGRCAAAMDGAADDAAGPNYTRQPAVDSYYEPLLAADRPTH